MLRTELSLFEKVKEGNKTVSILSESLGKSQSWISELVRKLTNENLLSKDGNINIASTYEASLLVSLSDKYNIKRVLSGKREDILKSLLSKPQSISELDRKGYTKSTIYNVINDLKGSGVVSEDEKGYHIADEDIRKFIEARKKTPFKEVYTNGSGKIIETRKKEEGEVTAFSAFSRYGIDYYPNKNYFYRSDKDLSIEDILIHAVKCAKNKKQMSMVGTFFLKHRSGLDMEKLWKLSRDWDCIEKWADLLAFIDRRDVKKKDLFPSWEEFENLSNEYDVEVREKYSEDKLKYSFEEIGNNLKDEMKVFLIGGVNLIFRNLKDSTKDIDVIVGSEDNYSRLVRVLEKMGYEEEYEVERMYEDLNTSGIFQREGSVRWDIFVNKVANGLELTEQMRERSDQRIEFGKMDLYLLALSDIFLFKSITDRSGDVEDVALIARRGEIDWNVVLNEIKRQDKITGRYFSFKVLDTLDILSEAYGIEVPIHDKLISYCLEKSLLITLDKSKTIDDLRSDLGFSDYQIYNKLRKLENEGKIVVDRSGKLNRYVVDEK